MVEPTLLTDRQQRGGFRATSGSPSAGTVLSSPKTLLQSLRRLYRDGVESDVRIVLGAGAERTVVRAHKLILAARCAGLRTWVEEEEEAKRRGRGRQERTDASGESELRWEDVSPHIALRAIKFFYIGEISLSDGIVFEMLEFSERIGASDITARARQHIVSNLRPNNCLTFLKHSQDYPHLGMDTHLMGYLRTNTHKILCTESFLSAPPSLVKLVLAEDELSCSEEHIWHSLVEWGLHRNSLTAPLSYLNGAETRAVLTTISPFLQPGLLRIFNLNGSLFATEIEARGLVSRREVLEKYRYDTILSEMTVAELYRPREDILQRTRRRIVVVESQHPHELGAMPMFTKQKVEMPPWCREILITFDMRSVLGSYSDLNIYLDAECSSSRMFSFYYETRERRKWSPEERAKPLTVLIPSNRFWFTFYSPANFKPEWGYRFQCYTLRNDLDREETALDRLARSNVYS